MQHRLNQILLNVCRRRLQTPRAEVQIAPTGSGEQSLAETRFLSELGRESDPSRPIVKIGTLFGYPTKLICLAEPIGQVFLTVVNYSWNPAELSSEDHLQLTSTVLAPLVEHENVVQIRENKDESYSKYSFQPPALVFLDAVHSYSATLADLEWASSVGALIISGDEFSPDVFPGVVKAVAELGGTARVVDKLFRLSGATPVKSRWSRCGSDPG